MATSRGSEPLAAADLPDQTDLFDGLADAVVIGDRDGRIVYANPAVEGLLGWTSAELQGRPLTTIQPLRLHAAHRAAYRRCLDGNGSVEPSQPLRVPALRRDGVEVQVELTLSLVRRAAGAGVAVGVLRDLRSHVELERHLRASQSLHAATEVAARLESHRGPDAIAGAVVLALVERLDAGWAQMWLPDGEGGPVRLRAQRRSRAASSLVPARAIRRAVEDVARTRRPVTGGDLPWSSAGGDAVLPLVLDDVLEGVVVCGRAEPLRDEMAEILATFAVLVAARLREARLFAAVHEARAQSDAALERAAFLGEAGRILSSSLDFAETLQRVADLAVRRVADWCVVDLLVDGSLQRTAVAHRDAALQTAAQDLARRFPSPPDAPAGAWAAVRTGRPQVVESIPQELLDWYADEPDHLAGMRHLGFGSYVAVPLTTGRRTLGAIVCYVRDAGSPVDLRDVAALEHLGLQAALAVDNARLFADLQREHARSESARAQVDALFRAAPIGLSMLDTQLRHVRANEQLAAMLGHSPAELADATPSEVLGHEGLRTERVLQRVLDSGAAVLDLPVSPDPAMTAGVPQAWRLSAYPVADSSGQLLGVGAILEDVTDQQRITQLLDQERGFLSAVLDNLEVAVVACDADGELTVFNGAAERFHGLPLQRVPPERWAEHYDLFEPDGETRMAADAVPLMRALHGEVVRDAEMVIAPRHGDARIVQCNAQPLFDDHGRKIGAVVAQHDVTQRKQAEARLTRQALHDPLTALPNRLLLLDRLRQALARADRRPGSVAVLFLDFDRFKLVNDSFGHDVGDQLLVAIGDRLRGSVRPADTVARLGGDEFVVLCEDIDGRAEAARLVRRLESALVATPLLEADGTEVMLTASIGVAIAGGGDERPETLLRNADAAMYRAKDGGRGRSAMFDDSFRAAAVDRLRTENALRHALERDRLELLYQPVLDLDSGALVGAEALLRYRDPERGLVAPRAFLDVAEDTGLIVPIGTWAIVEACAQLAAWRREADVPDDLHVSVNLSARQLADPGLVATLERALAHQQLPASAVSLEITESVLIEAAGSTLRVLDRLKGVGSKLGIDDFGTGYSSLTYLRRFPVDFVKIDRSFVEGLGADPEDTAIVTAVVRLGQSLGLATVAEGVESSDQLRILRDLGCDRAQGYHVARPQAAGAVTEALRAAGPR